jgi:hypothetical protein
MKSGNFCLAEVETFGFHWKTAKLKFEQEVKKLNFLNQMHETVK